MEKVNILLVDDQPGKLLSYQAILSGLGENLVVATSGRDALQFLLKEECALILLDVVMPEMDGFETASMIRQRPRLEQTPIIFITAYSTSDFDRIKGYELGAVDYVFSPIVPEILRAKVWAFVELFRKRKELANANERLRAEIDERKHAQAQLQVSEERIRLILDNVRDYGIIKLDPEGRVVTWNAGAQRVMGFTPEEILGQHFSVFYPASEVEKHQPKKELQEAADQGRFEAESWRMRKGSTLFWANVVVTPLRDSAGGLLGFVMVTRDLTERKLSQEQALRTERLAAIGQMVAGLAHESRNALQQVQASVEMLSRRIKTEQESSLVGEIQKAHDRLHFLLEEVRGYAAPLKLSCKVCDLSGVWQEAWNQLDALRRARAAQLQELQGDLNLRCLIDPFRMEQVFRNIFENSLAACSDPVRIDVRCSPAMLAGRPALRVCVSDNGAGLTEDQRQRIFEPFFTTKARGTGLGMAIAKRVVEAHGGQIAVGDDPRAGTTIIVILPKGQT